MLSLHNACKSRSFEQIQKAVADIVADGFSASVLLEQVCVSVCGVVCVRAYGRARVLRPPPLLPPPPSSPSA